MQLRKARKTTLTRHYRPEKNKNMQKHHRGDHRLTGTFRLTGAVTLLPEKKLHSARKRGLYTRTQIAVKTKNVLTSNETIIIPKTQWNSEFCNLQGKQKLLLKIR